MPSHFINKGLFLSIVRYNKIILFTAVITNCINIHAQENPTSKNTIPIAFLEETTHSTIKISDKLNKINEKLVKYFLKQEIKLNQKLYKTDSNITKIAKADIADKYNSLSQNITGNATAKYIPQFDTLLTSLKFLKSNPNWLSDTGDVKANMEKANAALSSIQKKMKDAENISVFIQKRKQILKEQFHKLGITRKYIKINKKAYYFSAQINEYKKILSDPKRVVKKGLQMLSKSSAFQNFMRKNSYFATMFRIPDNPENGTNPGSFAGLQTRAQVNNLIQQQITSGGTVAQTHFRNNLETAQSQLTKLKNTIRNSGGSNSEDPTPEGFKPNTQKTKSFAKRIVLGINIQNQKSTYFYPVTSDLGIFFAYKMNDKSQIGIGASYKIGWGHGWKQLDISSEGIGMRSFIDWKIKGSYWLFGGFEQNYKSAFKRFSQLRDINAWQQSGLIGFSKQISLKSNFLKKARLEILWDFLSYNQFPKTSPVLFRFGYSFN